jgi:hypothetical protein
MESVVLEVAFNRPGVLPCGGFAVAPSTRARSRRHEVERRDATRNVSRAS